MLTCRDGPYIENSSSLNYGLQQIVADDSIRKKSEKTNEDCMGEILVAYA